jgi:hypothetical protein
MTDLIFRHDGTVALPTNGDPAVQAVLGYSRYFLGLDLGRNDPSAFVLLHDEQLPEWGPAGQQRLSERRRTVVWADRVRDTAYTDLARYTASMLAKPALQGRTTLVVDATGLGMPFCDVLTEGGIDHIAVTMTAGQNWTRRGNKVSVAKNVLLESLATGFETNALAIAANLLLKDQLLAEVQSFELETTAAGSLVLSGGGRGHHADMAIALALSFFASNALFGEFIEMVPIRGLY